MSPDSADSAIKEDTLIALLVTGASGFVGRRLSGVLAAAGASLAGYLLATNLFELQYHFSLNLWLAGAVLGMVFVGLSGMAATWRVVTHAPVSVLRAV